MVWKEVEYGDMSQWEEREMLVTECNLLKELDSPNVVAYYSHINDKQRSIITITMMYFIADYSRGERR